MTSSGSAAPGRRLLVATAVVHYSKAPQWDRPGLAGARQQVIDLFTGVLGYTYVSELGLDPTETQLTEHLRTLCRHHVQPEDHLVVYIAGHGEVLDDGGGRHVLLTADTDPDDVADALPTLRLADRMLLGTPVQKLLLLLDTCYSGSGGNQVAAAVLAGMQREWTTSGSGLVVVTSTQPFEQAETRAFPALLSAVVQALPTAGHVPPSLDLGGVVQAMNSHPERPAHQQIGWAALGLTGTLPDFLPNPGYQLSARRHYRIFLCHSSGDKRRVRRLYHRLCEKGFDPWLDTEKIVAGQDWDAEIRKAVRATDLVIVCLSKASIAKTGYVQREIRMVLDLADEQPEGKIFIIPAKLEACELPDRLKRWQWVELYRPGGYERLFAALARASSTNPS